MAKEAFDPRNDLEQQLLALWDGQIVSDDFIKVLMESQVFMPVQDEDQIKGFQRSAHAQPLVLVAEGDIPVLMLFSSPERAKRFLEDFPDYKGGLLAEFKWVLEKMSTGVGIALNPGWETGFDLDPEMVAQLSQNLPSPDPV